MTGRSAAAFCAARGADVVLADERPGDPPGPVAPGVRVRAGEPFPDPAGFDLVVPSPGVPRERWAAAREAAGDVELAGRMLTVPIAAVTGTNGKSTTVLLLEALLRASGLRAEAAGNLGRPVLDLVGKPLDVAVVEVSSFQLEAVERFRPRVAVWLNTTPDHLDRHGDFETYAATKARLLARQGPEDVAVLAGDDPVVMAHAQTRARVWRFTREGPCVPGAWLEGDTAVVDDGGGAVRVPLAGRLEGIPRDNVLAALLAARALGADLAQAATGLLEFRPLPHRLEPVAEHGGVLFVNDSKATNPGAAAGALRQMRRPVVWIAGGRDKGVPYEAVVEAARGRVQHALLVGEAAPAIARALGQSVPHEQVGTVPEAVRRAAILARPGDVVLLAPACASFDQFESFEDRGTCFRQTVASVANDAEPGGPGAGGSS